MDYFEQDYSRIEKENRLVDRVIIGFSFAVVLMTLITIVMGIYF